EMDSLFAVLNFEHGAGRSKSARDLIAEAAPRAVVDGRVVHAIDQGLHVRFNFFHGQWATALAVRKQGPGLAMQYVNARPDLEADVRLGVDTPVMKNAEAGVVTEKTCRTPDRPIAEIFFIFASNGSYQLLGELDYFALSALFLANHIAISI
ncbi:MAG: hypothetical protein Q8M46_00365, partial [Thiobacillus sp.]|nr:hypothetical protein [Thiobacillus sp.]